jgi:intracellular sulfur oxidation DsrE/DsrF family protein
MSKDNMYSEEQIGAFTDGELEPEEQSQILAESERCPELDQQLCQSRKLKELVQHAYREIPEARVRETRGMRRKGLLSLAAAALLLFAVGLAAGWFVSQSYRAHAGQTTMTAHTSPIGQESWLLHVSSPDPATMQRALDRAKKLMANPTARVEVVANEGAVNMLRRDMTPFSKEIRELSEQDVLFFACSRAIQRLEEQGVHVNLVPEANTDYSALDRVVLRMQQGWTYEKI